MCQTILSVNKGSKSFKAVIAFNRDNTFQMNFDARVRADENKPVLSLSLQGTYKQSGAVLEFDNLVGDVGLLSQQKKALLQSVNETEIRIFDPSKGTLNAVQFFKVTPTRTTDMKLSAFAVSLCCLL